MTRTALYLCLLCCLCVSCRQVQPYEKENLSKYSMDPTKGETLQTFESKVFSVLESAGGSEDQAVGGGCGCN